MNKTKITSEAIIESLTKNYALKRKHASFWNFYKKTSKELGLFSEVFDRFQIEFGNDIREWELCENDPPDIVAKLSNGKIKGIEITELVNEQAIRAQIKNQEYFEELLKLDYQEAVIKLREILSEKENKLSQIQSKYDGLSLLVHTDELLLQSDQFVDKGSEIFPQGSKIFEAVYLLFSYEPDKQICPVLRLI